MSDMSTLMGLDRRGFLGRAAAGLAASRLGMVGAALEQLACAVPPASAHAGLASLGSATAWLNSPALTASGLRDKVVLVDFCTYTCINWLRTLPYVRAWDERYRDKGLVTIGVHSPEFAFEHDLSNVRRAVADLGVAHPVAVDNDFAIWRAFDNAYWPALYLVDAEGRLRFQHFGEGEYERSEQMIQRLLGEAGSGDAVNGLVTVAPSGVERAADWGRLKSPETYLGYGRSERFASPGGVRRNARHVYRAPTRLALNDWALSGEWTVGMQPVRLVAPGGRIAYRFHARDLHLVMGPATRGTPVRFRVSLDGLSPLEDCGADVDREGSGVATEQRLYQLIRQTKSVAERRFEIEFLDAGVEAWAFTFG